MYSVASCSAEIRGEEENTGTMSRGDAHAAWNFLLACAATPFTREHRLRLDAGIEDGLDWRAVLNLAEVGGLLPVLYERLGEIGGSVPDEIRHAASRAFAQNARQALWLTQLLFNVSELFQRHGIEALAYKGPVLAQLLYGNVTLRQYSDIDILLRAADVPRAKALLEEAGFKTDLQLSAREQQAYLATGYEFTFHTVKNPNVLELQWRIVPRFWAIDFDMNGFFIRSQNIQMGGRSVATLGNEDLMLVLCTHAAKHAWSRLSWIRDVAGLAQSRDLDWDRVIRDGERLGIQRIVGATLLLAMRMLSTLVPSAVQRLIGADNAAVRIVEDVAHKLERGTEPAVDSLAYFRFIAHLRERRMDRYRFWWRLAATPGVGEWSLVRLSDLLFPLYRAVRFGRLGARLIRNR